MYQVHVTVVSFVAKVQRSPILTTLHHQVGPALLDITALLKRPNHRNVQRENTITGQDNGNAKNVVLVSIVPKDQRHVRLSVQKDISVLLALVT